MIPLPIVSSVLEKVFIAHEVYSAANNYLSKNPNTPATSKPVIPTKKGTPLKPSRKTVQKEKLKGLSDGLATGLGVLGLAVGTAVHQMSTSAKEQSIQKTALSEAQKALFPDAPLLTNQVMMQQSADAITDAINANSIVTASVFGTLDAQLSAIGSSLLAISSTLIEISDNYKEELEKADDLPYIDTDTFYDILEKTGFPHLEAFDLKNQELAMIEQLSKGGHSYIEIKQAITAFRKSLVPSADLLKFGTTAAGITSPSPIDETTGNVTSSQFPDLSSLTDWATSAKVKVDHDITPRTIEDLDGNSLAHASPMEIQAIKNASDSRLRTDQNNFEVDDSDFPDLMDSIPLLKFFGRESVYSPSPLPSLNPFSPF